MRRVALLALLVAACAAMPGNAASAAPQLLGLRLTNGSTPYRGDTRLLTTVSPNGDGFRDAVYLQFRLETPARVSLEIVQTDSATSDPEASTANVIQRLTPRGLPRGANVIVWKPRRDTPPRTYVARLTVSTRAGRHVYSNAVVRVQGIEAGFLKPSYSPGEEASVSVATDAKTLTFQVFAYGGGAFPSIRDLRTSGIAMTGAASTGAPIATRLRRSSSSAPATGRAASTSSASPPPTGASATRRSSSALGSSASSVSPWCSRPRPGRPTTSPTQTATAGATRGI
jgi:hypothetical protein